MLMTTPIQKALKNGAIMLLKNMKHPGNNNYFLNQ
jgi:hypothetical protein